MAFVIPYYIFCMEKSGIAFIENFQYTTLRRLTYQIFTKACFDNDKNYLF